MSLVDRSYGKEAPLFGAIRGRIYASFLVIFTIVVLCLRVFGCCGRGLVCFFLVLFCLRTGRYDTCAEACFLADSTF